MGKRGIEEGARERLEGQGGRGKGNGCTGSTSSGGGERWLERHFRRFFLCGVQCNHPPTPPPKEKV